MRNKTELGTMTMEFSNNLAEEQNNQLDAPTSSVLKGPEISNENFNRERAEQQIKSRMKRESV